MLTDNERLRREFLVLKAAAKRMEAALILPERCAERLIASDCFRRAIKRTEPVEVFDHES